MIVLSGIWKIIIDTENNRVITAPINPRNRGYEICAGITMLFSVSMIIFHVSLRTTTAMAKLYTLLEHMSMGQANCPGWFMRVLYAR